MAHSIEANAGQHAAAPHPKLWVDLLVAFFFGFLLAWGATFLTLLNLGKESADARTSAFIVAPLVGMFIVVVGIIEHWRRNEQSRRHGETGGWMVDWMLGLIFVSGFLNLGFLILTAVAPGLFQRDETAAISHQGTPLSYGPPAARNVDLILGPGVSVELMPSALALARTRFEGFDVDPEGHIVVRDGSRLLEMVEGRELLPGTRIRSHAFLDGALVLVDESGRIGVPEGTEFRPLGQLPFAESDIIASSDRSRLLAYRRRRDEAGGTPAIISVEARSGAQGIVSAGYTVSTAGAGAIRTYFSVGRSLFRVQAPGRPELLFTLPEDNGPISGIVVAGDSVFFATSRGIYMLGETLAIPLVLGIGGPLQWNGADLFVLDSETDRIFRVAVQRGSST